MRSEAKAYTTYEALLVRLHELDREGALDSEEADRVRDQMDEPWTCLERFDRERLANLSADLTTGRSDHRPSRRPDELASLLAQAKEAFARHRWDDLLTLLRSTADQFPPSLVAYMRGRCWLAHGRPEEQAALLEWLAISLFELNAERTLVRAYFQDAIALDPLNENIRRNFEILHREAGAHVFETPLPVEPASVLHDIQDRLQPAA